LRLLNASGCLDALVAPEIARGLDAYVTKTVTPLPREGNAPVRIAETELGMLNAIGLANPGIDVFLEQHLPRLAELGVPLWVSVGGFSLDDYVCVAGRLAARDEVETLELNLSCPNVDEVPENVGEVVTAVRAVTSKPLYAKLSAAVADLGATARAAEAAGADGDVARAGREQLQRVPSAGHSAHANDWQARLAEACVDGRERDRSQRRTGEPAHPAG